MPKLGRLKNVEVIIPSYRVFSELSEYLEFGETEQKLWPVKDSNV